MQKSTKWLNVCLLGSMGISVVLPHCFLYLEGQIRTSKLHQQLQTSPSSLTYVLLNKYTSIYWVFHQFYNASTTISPTIQKYTVQQCRQQWNLINYIVPQWEHWVLKHKTATFISSTQHKGCIRHKSKVATSPGCSYKGVCCCIKDTWL